jgi:serine/threonine-protein kinase HipA
MANRLKVFTGGTAAGALYRSGREEDCFYFSYEPGCPPEAAVSLTMPVVADPYDSMGGLLPLFDMNLPEGPLRHRLEVMFSKAVPDFDALSLLEIVGGSQIGRLRYTAGDEQPAEVPEESVERLLTFRGAEDLFQDLLERFSRHSGVSGMQPKVLLRDASPLPKIANRGATHIVKSFDAREYPELAANEYFCLCAARHAGLPTAEARLSEDRRLLVVTRFDLAPGGDYLGFEDFCVLSAMRSEGRYRGSYEKMARQIALFVSPQNRPAALRQFFASVALSVVLGNGDAHLKNFGILYDRPGGEVRLAPVYDMLSTLPYQPKDVLALELAESKAFPARKTLAAFGRTACGLSSAQVESLLQGVVSGVHLAVADMANYAAAHPDFQGTADYLSRLFRTGAERLTA